MWCRNCQQDVPGIASEQSGVCCARCQTVLSPPSVGRGRGAVGVAHENEARENSPGEAVAAANPTPPRPFDDWEFDEQLRAAARLVKRHQGTRGGAEKAVPTPHYRLDVAPAPPSFAADERDAPARRGRTRPPAVLAWTILSLGLMTFVCGAVLLVWSFFGQRPDLWPLGLPLTLVGQAGLVIGVVLQLDSLWQSNADTSQTLNDLDDRLADLRRATSLLGSAQATAGQSFYAHFADGAPPDMLLADLKGQLDLLAARLGRSGRGH